MPKIPLWKQEDKKDHFVSGIDWSIFGMITSFVIFSNPYMWVLCSFSLALCAGIIKEIEDYFDQKHHTPDIWDAVATILGGILAPGVLLVILLLL